MTPRNWFRKEIYIRLATNEEFAATMRFAGVRVWTRRFLFIPAPHIVVPEVDQHSPSMQPTSRYPKDWPAIRGL